MEGWIKLHRQIIDHWIYKDPIKFKWWVDILFMVNHEDNKINIGFELFDCKRGQSIMSLQNWAARWNVNKDTARNFLKLLEKDGMILHENLSKTTRLTVCNYDNYQTSLHDRQTTGKRKTNARQTVSDPNKNDKNDKEYIYNNFYDSEIEKSKNDENYINFVKVIFGLNSLSKKLERVLAMQEQVTFEQFKAIYNYKIHHNISIGDYLVKMENYKDLTKKNTVVQATLLNWIRRDYK